MSQIGRITKIQNDRIFIEVAGSPPPEPGTAANCCSELPSVTIEARNPLRFELQEGQMVEFGFPRAQQNYFAPLSFFLPLALFFLAYLGSPVWLGWTEEKRRILAAMLGLLVGLPMPIIYFRFRAKPRIPEILAKRGV